MKSNHTRRALFTSVMALVLCFAMLTGTTFAWFTDQETSGNNVIKAGNLDVEMYYQNKSTTDWVQITETTDVFKDGALWEPGHVETLRIKIANEGNLALKYELGINVNGETTSVSVLENEIKLSDCIYYGVVEGDHDYADRATAVGAVKDSAAKLSSNYVAEGKLDVESNKEAYYTLVVYMPEDVGNEANHKAGAAAPTIDLGIKLFATQVEAEKDAFDENYDKDADVKVTTTVTDAEQALKDGFATVIENLNDTSAEITIPAGAKALTVRNSTLASITAEADATVIIEGDVTLKATSGSAISAAGDLTLSGDGNLTAIGGNGVNSDNGGSGITAKNITIDGLTSLTAEGWGAHAYGIGGDSTESITVKNTTVASVQGGYVQPNLVNDTSYGKSEPEGGAAIGSGYNGAVITLENVKVTKADGGSKAAAIGAQFHTGVTVNITNCTILEANGGNASAGIGGSRVSSNAVNENVYINIKDSTVTAKGGEFAAGIGAGYDTHCQAPADAPTCTINITGNSVITATGGKYGAGIGTGYHTAMLKGAIENTVTVNATAGGNREKYTYAMAVGFGVIDHTREAGTGNDSSFVYNGTTITVASAPLVNP